jgi:hypothetical protein
MLWGEWSGELFETQYGSPLSILCNSILCKQIFRTAAGTTEKQSHGFAHGWQYSVRDWPQMVGKE